MSAFNAYDAWKAEANNHAGPMQMPAAGCWFLQTDTGFRVVNTSTDPVSFMVQVRMETTVDLVVDGGPVHNWFPSAKGGSVAIVMGPDSVGDVHLTLAKAPRRDPRITLGTGLYGARRSMSGWAVW